MAPAFVAVCGPNGSGKSTLTRAISDRGCKIFDPDAIARELGDAATALRSGRVTLQRIDACLSSHETMVVESTLSGTWIIGAMQKAAKLGFYVELHFVGLDQIETAILRVRDRVSKGGHDIPIADQRRRFPKSFNNLRTAMAIADRTWLYDNSTKKSHILLTNFVKGTHPVVQKSWPEWAKAAVSGTIS